MGANYNANAYKLIYQHKDWEATARDYELHFAANLYRSPYVQQAAKTALTKLSRMLNVYYGPGGHGAANGNAANPQVTQDAAAAAEMAGNVAGEPVEVTDILAEALLPDESRGSSSGSAGQIGSRWGKLKASNPQSSDQELQNARNQDIQNLDAVINGDGNLREQMTLLYNGMFVNGGRKKSEIAASHSLKNMMAMITEDDIRQNPELAGVRLDLLSEMDKRKEQEDVFDTFSIARDLKKYSDKKEGKGNLIQRFFSGLSRAFNAALSSKFSRKTIAKEKRRGLGMEHYNALGVGLSERERENSFDETTGNIRWQEGSTIYQMKEPVDSNGMLQTAGPSGTALRMLAAYKLMGASYKDLLEFRLALIAWMGTSKDHSLFEILTGSHNAGVAGDEDLTEPSKMYMSVDPLPVDIIRNEYAPNREFPHETVYKTMLNELRENRVRKGLERMKKENKEDLDIDKRFQEINDKKMDIEILQENARELQNEFNSRLTILNAINDIFVQFQDKIEEVINLARVLENEGFLNMGESQVFEASDGESFFMEGLLEYLLKQAESSPYEEPEGVRDLLEQFYKLTAETPLEELIDQEQMIQDQRKYVLNEIKIRQDELKNDKMASLDEDFTLYSKFGGTENVGKDAHNGTARQLALNIYTTGAYLTMTRSAKYIIQAMGRMALKDDRVDQDVVEGGSYENSSSAEAKDSKLLDEISDNIRVSSRIAQDSLEEIGSDGGGAYVGQAYRGTRIDGGLNGSVGTEITIKALTSSSRNLDIASSFYADSVKKEGEDNAAIIQYQMTGKGSVDISEYSKYGEAEVLIPPGTKFKITKAIKKYPISATEIHWDQTREETDGSSYVDAKMANVVCLEEVSGPGEKKRSAQGEAAQIRNKVREEHQAGMWRRMNQVAAM